jgi:hypothetical protein
MSVRPPRYRAYLLRCWAERSPDPAAPARWRFSLEDPRDGGRRGFADLAALTAFLAGTLAGAAGAGAPDARGPSITTER